MNKDRKKINCSKLLFEFIVLLFFRLKLRHLFPFLSAPFLLPVFSWYKFYNKILQIISSWKNSVVSLHMPAIMGSHNLPPRIIACNAIRLGKIAPAEVEWCVFSMNLYLSSWMSTDNACTLSHEQRYWALLK